MWELYNLFMDNFDGILRTAKIDKTHLAKAIGVCRTSMYGYSRGDNIPSAETFCMMYDYIYERLLQYKDVPKPKFIYDIYPKLKSQEKLAL